MSKKNNLSLRKKQHEFELRREQEEKEKKAKKLQAKKNKMKDQMALKFEPRHNICALLDVNISEAQPYVEMFHFLRRSRIFYAITATSAISYNNIAQFWSTAALHCEIEPPTILANVAGHEIRITEDSIRTVLRFGDNAEDRTEFPLSLINGCFHRMGYVKNFNDSQLRKTNLSPVWRFLMHILIVCLSARKAGLDGIGQSLQSAMVALVLNKPYNFSKYVFLSMIHNAGPSQHKFLMFPRFVQLLLNAQVQNLPMEGIPLNLTPMAKRIFADCRQYGKYVTPDATPLFGHIINENYQAPADDNWIDQDQPDLPPQQEQPSPQAQSPDDDVEQERRTKRRHSSPPAPAPEVHESQEEAEDADDDDDSNAPLDPAILARMQRIVSPRRFQRLQRASQRASQRAFPTSQSSSSRPAKRTRDADPIAVPDPQPRVRRQRIESTSQAPSSAQNPLSHLLSVVSSLKDQVQAMQTTIDSQQQQLEDQDLRISSLESELQALKTTSVVQEENSDTHLNDKQLILEFVEFLTKCSSGTC